MLFNVSYLRISSISVHDMFALDLWHALDLWQTALVSIRATSNGSAATALVIIRLARCVLRARDGVNEEERSTLIKFLVQATMMTDEEYNKTACHQCK